MPDTPLRRAIETTYARLAPSLAASSDPLRFQVEKDFAASRRFRVLPVRRYRWPRAYANQEYLSLLRTHSDHILLPAGECDALIHALGDVLAALGSEIVVDFETHLMVGHLHS